MRNARASTSGEDAARGAVLVVDDVDANLTAMHAVLDELNCDIVSVRTGNEALRQLLDRDFAVILLDVQMPGMDGYEVARYARQNPATREIPIVFLTAGGSETPRRDSQRPGARVSGESRVCPSHVSQRWEAARTSIFPPKPPRTHRRGPGTWHSTD